MSTNDNTTEKKRELTAQQLHQRRKMVIYPLFGILFLGCLWLIFRPSSSSNSLLMEGLNTELPMPAEGEIIDNKITAYEQDIYLENSRNRRMALDEFEFAMESSQEVSIQEDISVTSSLSSPIPNNSAIQTSAALYQDISRQVSTMYEPYYDDKEQEMLALEYRIQELEKVIEEKEVTKSRREEQLDLMEKSYELAAKYFPNTEQNQTTSVAPEYKYEANKTVDATPVSKVRSTVVSYLAPSMDEETLLEELSKPRNFSFNSAVGKTLDQHKNTIRACVHQTVTVTNGQELLIRLLEPIKVAETTIPANTLLTGVTKINGERLSIHVSSVEYAGNVYPISLQVYDTFGMPGVAIPGSDEVNAAKEIAANMSSNMGTTINLSRQGAGEQLLTDLGRSVIQGTSQYAAKKIRTVKVTLKASHQLLLLPM